MDQEHQFPDARQYPPGSWARLAAAATQVRLQHRLASATMADATGIASPLDTVVCESCASVQMSGFPRLIPSDAVRAPPTIPAAAAARPNQDPVAAENSRYNFVCGSCISCGRGATNGLSAIQVPNASLGNGGDEQAILPVCSHCVLQDAREVAKLKNVVEHAISEMHWYAGKMQRLSETRVASTDMIEGSRYNTMLDKFDTLARMLQRLHLYCQDAADAPAVVALPELKHVLRQIPGDVAAPSPDDM